MGWEEEEERGDGPCRVHRVRSESGRGCCTNVSGVSRPASTP